VIVQRFTDAADILKYGNASTIHVSYKPRNLAVDTRFGGTGAAAAAVACIVADAD
jgi:hypothetical protein